MNYFKNLNKRVTVFVLFLLLSSFALTQLKAQETYNLQTDSLALVALYNATNGPGWTNHTNWLTGNLNTWYGVKVTDSRVTEIELGSIHNLVGNLPSELGNLSKLTSLSMIGNPQLSGPIPVELGQLSNLTGLRLLNCQLTGSIPSELGNLSNLTSLELAMNQLNGTIPPELGSLSKLTWLSLGSNLLSGSIPPELGNLLNLTYLKLGLNQLSGSIPPGLGSLSNLKNFFLNNNLLSGSIPSELGSLSNLITLDLGSNRLNGTIPHELGNLSKLSSLYLWSNQLNGSIPPELGRLSNLAALYLSYNQLSGSIPPELGDLSSLKDLFFDQNQLGGSIPPELGNLSNLTRMYLRFNRLNGTIPPELGNLMNLTSLALYGNHLSGAIPPELGKLSNLGGLQLGNNQLTGSIPEEFGNLSKLQLIYLDGNQLRGSIPSEWGNLPNLTHLWLHNNQLSGTVPIELSKSPKLLWIDLKANKFGFNDISSSIILPDEIFRFDYAPQAKQPAPSQTINVKQVTLTVADNHPANHYAWYVNGVSIAGNDSSAYTFAPTVNTTVYVKITNDIYTVPGNTNQNLVLETEPVTVVPVIDATLPTVIVQDITIQLNELGTASITADQIDNGSNDAFGIASMLVSPTTFECSHVGANTVTLTVTDTNGNVASANAVVTVQDTIAPVLSIPANIVQLNDAGVCGAAVTIGQATATDNCSIATLTNNSPAFFPVGITTVTWTAIDLNGNTTTATQTVEITNTAPVISGLTVSTFMQADGSVMASANHSDNNLVTGTWNWGDGSSTASAIEGSQISGSHIFNQNGLYNVTLTIEDACGTTDTKAFEYLKTYNRQTDSLALVALYNATNGPGWTNKTNWLTGRLETWYAVKISANRVTEISFRYNNNMTGFIPPELGNLSKLSILNLCSNLSNPGNNQISGTIPPELGNLSNLTMLDLSYNQLNGIIPPELGSLSKLTFLSLGSNLLSGSIPSELGNLHNLTFLYLNYNQLSGSIPPELGSLSSLTSLSMGMNRLTGSIPPEIGNLSNLESLYLAGNQLSGSIPPELGNLSNLTVWSLDGNQLSGSIPPEIGNLSKLAGLYLRNNRLSGSIPPEFGNLSNLENLNLRNNQLSGSIPSELGNLSKLTSLQLFSNQFGFTDISNSTILPNEITTFSYAPQAKQPAPIQTINVNQVTLTVADNHPANHYTWFVNGVAIAGNDVSTYTFAPTVNTTVYVKITNDVYTVPGSPLQNLILETEPATVVPVIDATPPTVIVQDLTIQLNELGTAGITADQIDNGSNDAFGIASMVVSPTTFECSHVGANTVTLTVTDTNGNASTGSATITVQDTIAPLAIAQNITIELDATGAASITAAQINNGSTDACGIASMEVSKTAFDCSNVGTNTVVLTVTDVNGNSSIAEAVVTVQDNTIPVAIAQNVTIQLDESGAASIVANQINNGSTDACGIASMVVSKTAFDCSNVGTNTVVLTVTDVNGNASTGSATITVQDTIAPVAIAQNITIELDATGAASITAAQINNGSTDACGIASLSVSKTAFDCSNVETNSVVLTVTDTNGNVATAEAIVTVQDNIAPVLSVPANIVRLTDPGVCGAAVNIGQAVATDNCSIASLTNNAPAFFPVGITNVVWTVVDPGGNTTSGTQVVEIINNAPVIGGLSVSTQSQLGVTVTASATHADNNLVAGTWNWGDGSSTASAIVGSQISGNHVYSQPWLYNVTLTIEDACGITDTEVFNYVTIYNPCNGFVTGGGYINTPAGAYAANPSLSGKSNYGFNARYKKGESVPSGEFNFHFNSANFQVKGTSFDWLMVNNDQAILKGLATINGQAGYHFIASVVDGNFTVKNGTDYLRLIVWDNAGNVLYDNQNGDPDGAVASNLIDNGQMVIHKSKNGDCGSYEEDENEKNNQSDKNNMNENVSIVLTPVQIEMTVYPNPVVNAEVTISIENFGNSMAKVDLTSLNGQMVCSFPSVKFLGGKAKIDFKLSKLKSGNYLLRVSEIGTSRFGVTQIAVTEKK